MHLPNFLDAASDASAFEVSSISYSVVQDVYDVLGAAEPASPELPPLAARAVVSLNLALREAAGSPADERWRVAYDALAAFLDCYARQSRLTSDSDSFDRLSNFLVENADLVSVSAEKPPAFPRTLAHARRW